MSGSGRSASERTMRELRRRGYSVTRVEKWVPIPGHPAGGQRRDAFGFGDVLAACPRRRILMVQATTRNGLRAHVRAIIALDESVAERNRATGEDDPLPVLTWLAAGGKLEVWGWWKRDRRVDRRLWTFDAVRFILDGAGCLRTEDL